MRRVLACFSLVTLFLGMFAVPVSADPADDADSCSGEFTEGTLELDTSDDETRTWLQTNTCVVTTIGNTPWSIDTGHQNFAVHYEARTITTYTTVYSRTDSWEQVGVTPGAEEFSHWECVNPSTQETVGGPWSNDASDPRVGVPTQGQCAEAAEKYMGLPNTAKDWSIVRIVTRGEPIPVYDWVNGDLEIADQHHDGGTLVRGDWVGCYNKPSGTYLSTGGVRKNHSWRQAVVEGLR